MAAGGAQMRPSARAIATGVTYDVAAAIGKTPLQKLEPAAGPLLGRSARCHQLNTCLLRSE